MKTMSCKQLGGACDLTFSAESFEEIAELSKHHGMEMFEQKDVAHLKMMAKMKKMAEKPGAFESWMEEKKALFDSLPHQ